MASFIDKLGLGYFTKYINRLSNLKADSESPSFTGIPETTTPEETAPENQIVNVGYVNEHGGKVKYVEIENADMNEYVEYGRYNVKSGINLPTENGKYYVDIDINSEAKTIRQIAIPINVPTQKRDDFTPCDLTIMFENDINNYYNGNVWGFLSDIDNVDRVVVGDWIPTEVNGYTYDMEIACINCYEGECYDNNDPVYDGSGDGAVTKVPSHIDIISKQLYNTGHAWYGNSTSTSSNNGSADQQCPWLHSDLYAYLQDTVFTLLPQQLQDVVIEKCMLIEQRYSSSSSSLTEPTGECWQPIGKLWIPNEIEIFGSAVSSSSTYGNYGVQYETFDSASKRIRCRPSYSSATIWWSLPPCYGNSNNVVTVSASGNRNNNSASSTHYFHLCVRVELK